MTTDITVLKSLIALRLDINIWSARKKLTAADFGDTNLPPETLASLGFKKICSPEDLKIFATLKARAINMLDRIGVRFLGGWPIPESRIKDAMADLDLIAMEFDSAKNNFLHNYNQAVQDWIDQNKEWSDLITRSIVDVDTVRKRFGFSWQVYQVAPPKKSSAAHGQGQLDDAVSGLGNALFAEVAKAADEAWSKSYAGKTEVSQKALSPLRTIRDKLAGLSFIEPKVMPMVRLIDDGLKLAPARGVIRRSELLTARVDLFAAGSRSHDRTRASDHQRPKLQRHSRSLTVSTSAYRHTNTPHPSRNTTTKSRQSRALVKETYVMNTQLIIRCLPLLASTLGRKYGVTVEIGGPAAYTDGQTIRLPSLPTEADQTFLGLMRGYLDHESAYVRFTDFDLVNQPTSPHWSGTSGISWRIGGSNGKWRRCFPAVPITSHG